MTFELNPEQAQAAECLDSPVLVTAGAGSGKTRMLTQRLVNSIVPSAVEGWAAASVDEIVAITFTEKAAGELAERARLSLRAAGQSVAARDVGEAWISTIHGLCSRLLRRHPFEAGVDPLFAVADTVQAGELREGAFEAAARIVLGAGGGELFEAYQYGALFSAAKGIARDLAVLGLGPGDIDLEPVEDVRRLALEAQQLFRYGMTSCDLGYSGTSVAPQEHVVHCEELLGRCSVLVSAEGEEEARLGDLLGALDAYKPLKRRLKGLDEMAAELAEMKDSLSGRVAAAVVAPYARVLRDLAIAYMAEYAAGKAAAGLLDFDDLQIKAVELLERNPDLCRRYREQFRVVMIDEFQDTDALQLRLVEALSHNNLCTVGDEKQSIYRFRGADVDVYRLHRERMREQGAQVSKLFVNYRSHPELLGFVNAVFGSDEYFGGSLLKLAPPDGTRASKPMDAILGAAPRVEAVFVDTTDAGDGVGRRAEAAVVARRLAELRMAGAAAGDMAVLLRAYSHAHVYAEALSLEGIPAVVVGGSRFFELPEIITMRALNRAIANAEDDAALGLLLASDLAPVTSDALAILRWASGERDGRSLWELLRSGDDRLAPDDREAIERLVGVLESATRRVGSRPLAEVLLLAVEESGWDLRMFSTGNMGRDAFANVLKFARRASAFELSVGTGPTGFAAYLDTKERLGDTEAPASLADDKSDAVRIMSIHASKGLEFPIVVVPELGAGRPSDTSSIRTSRRGDVVAVALKTPAGANGQSRPCSTWFEEFSQVGAAADAEESSRVRYVAFTRAEEMLIISGKMGLRTQKPSSAKHDLAKLTRVLGVETPVTGPSDGIVTLAGSGVRCSVRITEAAEFSAAETPGGGAGAGILLAPAAGPVTVAPEVPAAPQRMSYTQFSEFEHCPRRFWIRRVMGVRAIGVEQGGESDPLRFGTALHAALRLVSAQGEPPAPERVSAIGRFFELQADGVQRLGEAVARYCGSDVAARVASRPSVRRESPFSMRIGESFLLTGAIDLYARDGDDALVVDYKSGVTGDGAELEERYHLQARCYALAVLRDGCSSATIEFVRPEVEAADGTMQRTTFTFAAAEASGIEQDLLRRYAEIEASAFEPTASHDCLHCDIPAGLCPHQGRAASGAVAGSGAS